MLVLPPSLHTEGTLQVCQPRDYQAYMEVWELIPDLKGTKGKHVLHTMCPSKLGRHAESRAAAVCQCQLGTAMRNLCTYLSESLSCW